MNRRLEEYAPETRSIMDRPCPWHGVLAVVGSLWFAAVLLMLVLIGMASATVYESLHGTERALATFYSSWWFVSLLSLLALNILASVAMRYPFTRKRLGFVITHGGLLIIVVGALATKYLAVDGVVALGEGQTVKQFRVRADSLSLLNRRDGARTEVVLPGGSFGGFVAADRPDAPPLRWGNLTVEVLRYLPDSVSVQRVVDDNPRLQPAVELSLAASGEEASRWVFAGGSIAFGPLSATYRHVSDASELAKLLAPDQVEASSSAAVVRVSVAGTSYDIAVEDCSEKAQKVGVTDYSVRVLRYLPHATVGEDNALVNASERTINPAIEVELRGPEGSERRIAFARFPDFQSMHGRESLGGIEVTFVASTSPAPVAAIEVLSGPDAALHVRFAPPGKPVTTRELTVGQAVDTPWPGRVLAVRRRFDHARVERIVEPVEPVRKERVPAVHVKLTTAAHAGEMWVQRGVAQPVTVDGTPFELFYGDRTAPLGFSLKLNDFQVRYYPGGEQPRSFESNISIVDPATGDARTHIVSMNNPVKYAGYTLFQSSYRFDKGAATSVLSVARDPGLPIVFAGYIVTLAGMVVRLVTRVVEQRRVERLLRGRMEP